MAFDLYSVGRLFDSGFGNAVVLAAPAALLAYAIIRQLRLMKVDLLVVIVLLSIFPALTAFLGEVLGYQYYTALNYDLQADRGLEVAAIILIWAFTFFVILGYRFAPLRERLLIRYEPIVFSKGVMVCVFSLLFVLLAKFLEAGTILTSGYGEIKSVGNPYSSVVNQIFNLFAALLLTYIGGKQRKRLIAIIYSAFILLALVMARRTLVIGLSLMFLYTVSEQKLTIKQITAILVLVVGLWFIGMVRAVGVVNFFSVLEVSPSRDYLSLPGGASNVFVGAMGVIDLVASKSLSFPETMPILLWPLGVTESQIYPSHGYDYNGGMHLASVLYWNFGFLGVALGGALFGMATRKAHFVLENLLDSTGGTLPAIISAAFVITLANTLWYSPIGLIKLTSAVVVAYLIGIGLKRLH